MEEEPDLTDDMANNILATGAIWAAISLDAVKGVIAKPVMDGGDATNQLDVTFDFLKSIYRITVERRTS